MAASARLASGLQRRNTGKLELSRKKTEFGICGGRDTHNPERKASTTCVLQNADKLVCMGTERGLGCMVWECRG